MEITERLLISKVLISKMSEILDQIDPYDDELPAIFAKTLHLKMKMKMFYAKHDEPELLEQLNLVETLIKKIEDIQNKRGMY